MLSEALIGTSRQSMWLKCSECGILKNGFDDMEVHMKTEHLNWLPFKCPICGCLRALNTQMREHLHSSHRCPSDSFHFEDNAEACSRLRDMMDNTVRSSFVCSSSNIVKKEDQTNEEITVPPCEQLEARSQIRSSTPSTPVVTPSAEDESCENRKRKEMVADSAETTPSSSYSAVAALLANGTSTEEDIVVKKMKIEEPEEEEDKNEDNDQMIVDPLAAYLSGLGVLFNGLEGETDGGELAKEVKVKKIRSSTVKYCTKCNKAVKSNEKGAHVSQHLSKDYKMNRFQCKIGECTHESYRKVNIVNHQMKMHGLIVADNTLINDRQHEMSHIYQAQLIELFGTNETEEASGDSNSQMKDVMGEDGIV